MKVDSFINQEDPSRDYTEDLKNIDIRQQYSKLTEDEKILIFMKLKGFTHRPPTIERLYSDEYYLGSDQFFNGGRSVFDFWKDAFKIILPNEVTTAKPLLGLAGCIN